MRPATIPKLNFYTGTVLVPEFQFCWVLAGGLGPDYYESKSWTKAQLFLRLGSPNIHGSCFIFGKELVPSKAYRPEHCHLIKSLLGIGSTSDRLG